MVEYHHISETSPYCALRAKVTPSQRVTEKPHQPWVYLNKNTAAVFCAHCTCMAGLGEVCSHVAALLFKMEIAVRLGLTSRSVTDESCKWNNAFRKELEPVTITNLQHLIKGKRTKPVPSIVPSGKDSLPDLSILQSLHGVCPDAVFFTTIPRLDPEETDTESETEQLYEIVRPLRDLYQEQSEEISDDKLKIIWATYRCTAEQAKELELETKGQAVCPLWFEQRKGRITASKAHDVLVRKDKTDPDKLVQLICGSKCYDLSNVKQVKWGVNNEEKAKSAYINHAKNCHKNLNVQNVGLLVDHENPFLAASPDGLVSCDCCEKRLLEIKCPYKHRDKVIQDITDKDFCLRSDYKLKTSHRYFTQIQLQMYIFKLMFCDFVVYTNKEFIVVSIGFDVEFSALLVETCKIFFLKFVLKELVTRKLENLNSVDTQTEVVEAGGTNVWCLCKEPEYGRMIECGNTDCPTQWFHYECVNIRRCPKGKWLCPECA
uniref:Uncharacterized protein n=1 Tax=Neogobius melanostomus TaxID=47308 RepID=A0A8C6TKY7_9GOBI